MDICIQPNPAAVLTPSNKPVARAAAVNEAAPAGDTVQITTYLQDPFVGPAEIRDFSAAKIGQDLTNDRVKIKDNRPLAKPDANGNFLMSPGSDGDSQVNAHVVTTNTLSMWEGYRGGKISWSFGDRALTVIPHKKQGMNAYYSRWEQSTNYFFQRSEELNTTVKTANSKDIVAHETGHAILDGMKPGYLGTYDRETGAFHEAFGDCSAMLATLKDPIQNERIIAETGGDLRKQNVLASLAEEFGKARKLANSDPSDDNKAWLRNALNKFTYVPPESLGDGRGDDDTLGGEIHSFARLFAGAFYDSLDAAYQQGLKTEKLPPANALTYAADTLGPLLARAVDRAPANRGHFKDIALGMIQADADTNGGKLGDDLKQIFINRKIITPADLQAEQERRAQLPQVTVDHNFTSPEEVSAYVAARADKLGLPAGIDFKTVSMSVNEAGEQVVNLLYSQSVPISGQGLGMFDGLTTDVTGGVTLAFDSKGRLSEYHHNDIDAEAIKQEMDGIAFLQRKDEIRDEQRDGSGILTQDDGKPYQAVVRGGKLVRVPASSCDCGGHHDH